MISMIHVDLKVQSYCFIHFANGLSRLFSRNKSQPQGSNITNDAVDLWLLLAWAAWALRLLTLLWRNVFPNSEWRTKLQPMLTAEDAKGIPTTVFSNTKTHEPWVYARCRGYLVVHNILISVNICLATQNLKKNRSQLLSNSRFLKAVCCRKPAAKGASAYKVPALPRVVTHPSKLSFEAGGHNVTATMDLILNFPYNDMSKNRI